MNFLLNFNNLLLIPTSTIFYILALVFFCGFVVVLLWYLLWNKKDKPNKQTKSWTIESAKKFLESNNIQVNDNSKDHLEENIKEPSKEEPIETKEIVDTEENNVNQEEIIFEENKESENQKENVTKANGTKTVKTETTKKPIAPKTAPKPTAKPVTKSTSKTATKKTIKKD